MSAASATIGEVSLDQILAALQDLTCTEDINLGELLQAFLNTNTNLFTFNANDGNVFAKVAMLIQSSATVYCRKVEFLYSLVLQMLELLKSKENRKDKGDKGVAEKAKKALSLENAKNIDIKEDCCKSNSIKDRSIVPVALLTMDDIEKGDELIFSSKGENVGNNKDFPLLAYVQPLSMMLLEQCSLKFVLNEDHLRNQVNIPSAFSQLPHDEDNMDCNDVYDPVMHDDSSNNENIADNHFENADNVSVRNFDLLTRNAAGNNLRNPPEVKSDPWTNLNHHVEIPNLVQSLKPALRLTRRPVTKLNRKRTRKKTDKTDDICRITNFMSNAYYSHSAKLPKREILPNDSALESLFYDEYQARQKIISKKRFPETLSSNGESSPLPDLPGMDMDGDSDFDDVIHNNDPFEENQDQFNMQSLGNLSPILEPDDDQEISPLDNTVAVGYEDLVRKYVERYLESAALYIQTTELTKRVREWEKKILPVLATEDQHEPYDIHVYGSKVLNNFNNNNRKETKDFSEIVKDKEPFETARILLATLQLANNYNVEISGVHPSIEITLLSRKRHLDEVMEYDAHATQKAR